MAAMNTVPHFLTNGPNDSGGSLEPEVASLELPDIEPEVEWTTSQIGDGQAVETTIEIHFARPAGPPLRWPGEELDPGGVIDARLAKSLDEIEKSGKWVLFKIDEQDVKRAVILRAKAQG